MKRRLLMGLTIVGVGLLSLASVTSCGGESGNNTADIVAQASQMSLADLEAAAEEEMTNSDDTFKVVALTSTMTSALKLFSETYDWLPESKTYCKNDYKDAALFTALEQADSSYFADFALVQDARSLGDYLEGGLLHNYVPSDYKEMGLAEEDTYPLKGIHFNKIFFCHTSCSL